LSSIERITKILNNSKIYAGAGGAQKPPYNLGVLPATLLGEVAIKMKMFQDKENCTKNALNA